MTWKKYTIFFNLLALPFAWLFIYCGWGGYEPPPSFFTPEIANKGRSHPLFYDPNSVFYTGYNAASDYDFNNNQATQNFSEINTLEWQGYFNKKVSQETIDYFLNNITERQSDSCLMYLKKEIRQWSDTTSKQRLNGIKDTKKAISFFTYLGYALQLQQEVNIYWDYDYQNSEDTFMLLNGKRLLAGLLKNLSAEKSNFIKARYCYQIERLYYRLEKYEDGVTFWKSHQQKLFDNSSYYRFMGYAAANYYKLRQFSSSNYLYSKIFDQFPLMQSEALWSFGLHEEGEFEASLANAKTTREKCVLWQMYGYSYDVKKAIEGIYSIDPKSNLLPVLLTRLVNKEEEQFLEVNYTYSYDRQIQHFSSEKLDHETFGMVEQIAAANNTSRPELWHLSAAYFNIIKQDFRKAKHHLDSAVMHDYSDSFYQGQWQIMALLYDITSNTSNTFDSRSPLTPEFESRLIKHLSWLQFANPKSALRTSDLYNWCKIYLADVYREQHRTLEAECFNTLSDYRFYTLANIDEMIRFLRNPSKTPFEAMLAQLFRFHPEDLITLKIHQLVYNGKFEEAASLQQHEPGSTSAEFFPANPFVIHIKDCHDCDFEAPQSVKYNEIRIIDTLVQLENAAHRKLSEAAENYFLMANCLYNITYYGNTRNFYRISMNEVFNNYDYYSEERSSTNLPIFDCRLSAFYYRKALESSNDKEFRAKCLFMIAKCRQNEEYNLSPKTPKQEEEAGEEFVTRDTIFYQLKTEYADTKYYQQIIEECGYFNSYLN